MTDIVLGIRLKADGTDLVGQVKVSEEALKKLREETGKNTSEAARLNQENKNLAQTLNASASSIGAYSALWNEVAGAVTRTASVVKDYIKDSALLAARHETLGVVMQVVGRNAGYSAAEMNMHAEAVRKSGISMVESRETVVKLAQANIDLALASKLARAAQDAAVIGNISSSEALERMTHGIVSGQTEILRAIGINVSFEASYSMLAKQLKVNTDQLTENEKVQARANVVLEYATRLQGTYEAAMGTAGKQLNSLKRYEEDLKTIRGEVWNDLLIVAVNAYTKSLQDATTQSQELARSGELKAWGREISELFVTGANWANNFAVALELVGNRIGGSAAMMARWASLDFVGAVVVGQEMNQRDLEIGDKFDRPLNAYNKWRATREADAARAQQREAILAFTGEGPLPRPQGGPRPAAGGKSAAESDAKMLAGMLAASEQAIDALDGETSRYEQTLRKLIATGKLYSDVTALDVLASDRKHDAMKKLRDETNRQIRQYEELERVEAERQAGYTAMHLSMSEQAIGIENETKLIGLSTREREMSVEKMKIEATYRAQLNKLQEDDLETLEKINAERARSLERLPGLVNGRADARETHEALTRSREELKRIEEDAARGLTDAIFRGGADGFSRLGETIKNYFKNLVIRIYVEPYMKQAVGAVTGALGVGGAGTAGASTGGIGGVTDLLGMANNASSLFGGGSGSGFLGGIGDMFSEGAGFAGLGTNEVMGSIFSSGTEMAAGAVGGAASSVLPYAGAIIQLAQGNVKGAALSAGLTAIGTAIMPGIGTVIGAVLGSLLGGMLGGDDKPPPEFSGYDLPNAHVNYSGMKGRIYANYSNRDYRTFLGEQAFGDGGRDQVRLIYDSIGKLGEQLGYDGDAVRGMKATVKTGVFTDITAEFPKMLQQLSDQLANQLIPNLAKFAQAGESSTQTLIRMAAAHEQLTMRETQINAGIAQFARGLPGQLGITDLERFQSSLAVSAYHSPLDRLAAARGQLSDIYGRAMGGDLSAVQGFAGIAQTTLGIGRDAYASGPEFAALFKEVNRELSDVLGKQRDLQTDLLKSIPISIIQGAQDQIAELRKVRADLNAGLQEVRRAIQQLHA